MAALQAPMLIIWHACAATWTPLTSYVGCQLPRVHQDMPALLEHDRSPVKGLTRTESAQHMLQLTASCLMHEHKQLGSLAGSHCLADLVQHWPRVLVAYKKAHIALLAGKLSRQRQTCHVPRPCHLSRTPVRTAASSAGFEDHGLGRGRGRGSLSAAGWALPAGPADLECDCCEAGSPGQWQLSISPCTRSLLTEG